MPNTHTHNATELEILEWLHSRMTNGQVSRSYTDIINATEFARSTVKTAIDKLEQQGLLEVDRSATPFRYEKTSAGEAVLEYGENTPTVSGEQPNKDNSERTVPSVNLHDFAVELPLSDESLIMRENRETILREFKELQYDDSNDEYYGDWDRFHFRISGDRVVIYVQGEYSGQSLSTTYVKNQALKDVERCRDWLSDNLNLRFEDDVVVEGRVISQDVSIEDHPLAQLAEEHGVNMKEGGVFSMDDDGNVRLKLDLSHGETGEVESSMRGKLSSDARLEESDIQNLCDDLLRMSQEREKLEKMWRYGEDRETIFRALSYLLGQDVDDSLVSGGKEQVDDAVNDPENPPGLENPTPSAEDSGKTTDFGSRLADECTVTSRWIDNHGNLMGYIEELGKPVKLQDSSELP